MKKLLQKYTTLFLFILIVYSLLCHDQCRAENITPGLFFDNPGNYQIYFKKVQWEKKSANLWCTNIQIIYCQENNHPPIQLFGFHQKNSRLYVHINKNMKKGNKIPIWVHTTKAPKQLKFQYASTINNPDTFIPFTNKMFVMDQTSPCYISFEHAVSQPHIYLSFIKNSQQNYPVEKKNLYGVLLHEASKNYYIQGHIAAHEWQKLAENINYAYMLTFSINSKRYLGVHYKKGKYFVDTKSTKKGRRIIILIKSQKNPGDLILRSQMHAKKQGTFSAFTINDFEFPNSSTMKVTAIEPDYIKDHPSLLLTIKTIDPGNNILINPCANNKGLNGFMFYSNGSYIVRAFIDEKEWQWDKKKSLQLATIYTFLINNNILYEGGYMNNCGQYIVDVGKADIFNKSRIPLEIQMNHSENPGSLEFIKNVNVQTAPEFFAFDKEDFTFCTKKHIKIVKINNSHKQPSIFLDTKSLATPKKIVTDKKDQQYPTVQKVYEDLILKKQFYCSESRDSDHIEALNKIQLIENISEIEFHRKLSQNSWRNTYEEKTNYTDNIFQKIDQFFLIQSEKMDHSKIHTFNCMPSSIDPVTYDEALKRISGCNKRNVAGINSWYIPTLEDLFHFFQLRAYKELSSNVLQRLLPNKSGNLYFWSSSCKKENEIFWVAVVQIQDDMNMLQHNSFLRKNIHLSFYPMHVKQERAYLLPVSMVNQ